MKNVKQIFFIDPMAETNEQFYNQIYTGQKISFGGKMHKDYQGKLWITYVSLRFSLILSFNYDC